MLKKEQIANLLVLGGTAIIAVKFETVELKGRAMIDSVEYRGTRRLRAKFGHGIKAILLMDEYGNTWTAEKAPDPELEAADEEETTEPQEKKISPNCIMVQKWRTENPQGSRKRCALETHISLPTVKRYWDEDRSIGQMEMPEY